MTSNTQRPFLSCSDPHSEPHLSDGWDVLTYWMTLLKGRRATMGQMSATYTTAQLRSPGYKCQRKSVFKLSFHSLSSTVCIVDALYGEGKSFLPSLDSDAILKTALKYFLTERTAMYLLGWHVCSQYPFLTFLRMVL